MIFSRVIQRAGFPVGYILDLIPSWIYNATGLPVGYRKGADSRFGYKVLGLIFRLVFGSCLFRFFVITRFCGVLWVCI